MKTKQNNIEEDINNNSDLKVANSIWEYCCDEIDKFTGLYAHLNEEEQILRFRKELEELHVKVQIKEPYFSKKFPVIVWMMIFNKMYHPKAFIKYLTRVAFEKKENKMTPNEISALYPLILYKQTVPKREQTQEQSSRIYSDFVNDLNKRDYDIETATKVAKEKQKVQNEIAYNDRSDEVINLLNTDKFTEEEKNMIAEIYNKALKRRKSWQDELDKLVEWYSANKRVPNYNSNEEHWIFDWIISHKKALDGDLLEKWQSDQLENFELWKLALDQFKKAQEASKKEREEKQKKLDEEKQKYKEEKTQRDKEKIIEPKDDYEKQIDEIAKLYELSQKNKK